MPKDSHIVVLDDGNAEIVQDGKPIVTVSAPIARDAQGQNVAGKFAVDGASLKVNVAHAGKDLAYPIAVDPVVNGGVLGWVEQAVNATDINPLHPDWYTDFVGYTNNSNRLNIVRDFTGGGSRRINIDSRGTSGSAYAYELLDPVRASSVVKTQWWYNKKPGANLNLAAGILGPQDWVANQWGAYYDSATI